MLKKYILVSFLVISRVYGLELYKQTDNTGMGKVERLSHIESYLQGQSKHLRDNVEKKIKNLEQGFDKYLKTKKEGLTKEDKLFIEKKLLALKEEVLSKALVQREKKDEEFKNEIKAMLETQKKEQLKLNEVVLQRLLAIEKMNSAMGEQQKK
ncbi:hypothetical protein HBN50_08385 [Halobacteriovorax sp. GB3]|uniref:hypothetical protein n=1 Tax=Halobacteriovorax sp. GB3 TaxID=2719615 RepID=UPI002361626C|nr:hypothetical protein [Halobacteriovorax sp. GB3]MDD0853111.1 hypothetical protein [Halobacteriovorax sp. GB3]